jgi:hypothetical protein
MTLQISLPEVLAPFRSGPEELVYLRMMLPKTAPKHLVRDYPTQVAPPISKTQPVSYRHLVAGSEYMKELIGENKRRGIFFVVNPGGDSDTDITRFVSTFSERDPEPGRDIDAFLISEGRRQAPLPYTALLQTYKSIHRHWGIDGECSREQWLLLQQGQIALYHSDPTISNESRVMRLPYFNHVRVDLVGDRLLYKPIELLEFNPENKYSVAELMAAFPAGPEGIKKVFEKLSGDKYKKVGIEPSDDLRKEVESIKKHPKSTNGKANSTNGNGHRRDYSGDKVTSLAEVLDRQRRGEAINIPEFVPGDYSDGGFQLDDIYFIEGTVKRITLQLANARQGTKADTLFQCGMILYGLVKGQLADEERITSALLDAVAMAGREDPQFDLSVAQGIARDAYNKSKETTIEELRRRDRSPSPPPTPESSPTNGNGAGKHHTGNGYHYEPEQQPEGIKESDPVSHQEPEHFKDRMDKADHKPNTPDAAGRIKIDIGLQEMTIINEACWAAIDRHNRPPVIFSYGNQVVRIARHRDGSVAIEPCTVRILRNELTKWTSWYKDIEFAKRTPPDKYIENVLATRDIHTKLPPLSRIVNVPVFGPDGTLKTQPGYDQDSGLYYAPLNGFEALPVPEFISSQSLDESRNLIAELFEDFPFADEADFHNAVALLILPFCRDMIDGPTPNHLIDASMAGSGKDLLGHAALLPGVGPNVGSMTQPRDEDEWRKALTTKLMQNEPVIYLENVPRKLDSDSFAAAITTAIWKQRILGGNTDTAIKISSIWVTTGNNVQVSTEHARRALQSRLTPKDSNPELRTNFKHPQLLRWAQENRPRLVRAAHIIIKYWLQQRRPEPSIPQIGSFQEWTRVIGGILQCAGFDKFATNYNRFLKGSDGSRTALSLFCVTVYEWLQKHGINKQGIKCASSTDLLPVALCVDGIEINGVTEKAQVTSLGSYLSTNNDVIVKYADEDQLPPKERIFKILRHGSHAGRQMWTVQCLDDSPEKGPPRS